MKFKKYSSIENSYNQRFLQKVLSHNPELMEMPYIIREKVDGANIQLLFSPNEPMKVGRRLDFLKPNEKFFDIWNTLERYKADLMEMQGYATLSGKTVIFYGELFGNGVQNRVHYGKNQSLSFFDVFIDNKYLSPKEVECLFGDMKMDWLLTPKIAITNTLTDALNINVNFNSTLSNLDNNFAEGVVIQPYEKVVYLFGTEDRWILKKKSEKFSEKENKSHKEAQPIDSELLTILTSFRSYINKNRVLSVFSKHGPMTEMKQMGSYIKLIMEDAKEDFLKEHKLPELDEKSLKIVFNVGTDCALLLKSLL